MAGGEAGSGGRRLRRVRSAGEARADVVSSPTRRRSERNMASAAQSMLQGKPSLGARKMMCSPVKEMALTSRRSPRISLKDNKENIPLRTTKVKSSDGGNAKMELKPSPPCCSLDLEVGPLPSGTGILSPISANTGESLPDDERDLAMAKRVRRSYSRMEISLTRSFLEKQESPNSGHSDTSTPNHGPVKRQTLFGFEKFLVPEELVNVSPVNADATQKSTVAEPSTIKELDIDIPGISFVKEKRRKKKMPQFDEAELDEWATQMNAEFEEAERFGLLVE
ncbi:sororin isoform X2 [Rhineura floridana]|uniref:sororin isoform X2 n=1 Tax=Rhineura floridana TaxID=261503 RepID=UPI002AC86B62|nr:sororin isoform X2 [Rhineura floridana]